LFNDRTPRSAAGFLEVSATSVRLISRDVAIEEGTARVLRPGAVPEELSRISSPTR
jgi:hypothetical protein